MQCQNPIEIPLTYEANRKTSTDVRCKKCLPCLITTRNDWAIRQILEAKMYPQDHVAFVTFTHNSKTLPYTQSIYKETIRTTLKQLKKNTRKDRETTVNIDGENRKFKLRPVKHYSCGEYGSEGNRPHYHSNIFGLNVLNHRFSGDWDYHIKQFGKMLQLEDISRRQILQLQKSITPIELEMLRAWNYKGKVQVSVTNYSRMQYVAAHNTKHLTKNYHPHAEHPEMKDYITRLEEDQNPEFHIQTPGLGFDFIDEILVPLYKQENMFPFEHPNMRTHADKPPRIVPGLNQINININGKKRLQHIPERLERRIEKHLGGDIRTDREKYLKHQYANQILKQDLIKHIGRERYIEVETESEQQQEARLRKLIENDRRKQRLL